MILVDTHAHLYSEKFNDDINDVIKRSQDEGVERIYMPNIDSKSIDSMLELEQNFPGYCIPTMGLHPCHVDKDFEKELYIVEDWLSKRPFVAVGEMGTDLYWDKTNFELQKKAFIIQCDLAVKYDIPIIIHCRESVAETIQMVADFSNEKLKGIFHCFNGDLKQAHEVIDLGFVIGIGGVATFKNGGLDDLVKGTDLQHIVLETDSPYLAPVPYRGKRNEPSYVNEVAKKVSELKQMDLDEVGKITTENAYRVYGNV